MEGCNVAHEVTFTFHLSHPLTWFLDKGEFSPKTGGFHENILEKKNISCFSNFFFIKAAS